jgi:polyhydroxyalkanoate synthesis repressor PhaR
LAYESAIYEAEAMWRGLVVAYVIKRYANRKLYDPQESRYVTLEELEEMIRAGREIAVTDATTGEDLTAMVLAQIILEKARHRRPSLPTAFLHQLIQYGEAWQDFAVASLKTSLEGVMTSQREADRVLREWAAGCGWMPPAQRASVQSTPEAEMPPTVSQELTQLRQEIAVLREQLQTLAARLPQEPTP